MGFEVEVFFGGEVKSFKGWGQIPTPLESILWGGGGGVANNYYLDLLIVLLLPGFD